ncbi:hypothetical protein FXV91_15040 [Methanosarcina sp. DH2]|uniref:hypothetical protein n=1 Tax=Methanosarcina sp. DH2 TaxID=2605639 RepID=UPI001E544F79|nr:hypothetical protein [Methanosarcina sp. DH2]MCC4771429.1 hypothetical protein [Methanosarcina sp. DH2]
MTENTFAYFYDVEYSAGNAMTAAVWDNEADHLIVSDSKLIENGEKLQGITFDVSGTQSVTIDKIQIWWDISKGDARSITEIKVHGKEFFTGSRKVGEVMDVENYVLGNDSSANLEFYFDSDIFSLAPFTINIIMGDGSVRSFVTDPKYRSNFQESFAADPQIESPNAQEASGIDTGQKEQEVSAPNTEVIETESSQEYGSVNGQEAPVPVQKIVSNRKNT